MTSASADWLIVAAPVLGAIVNLFGQICLGRLVPRWSLMRTIIAAFLLGTAATAVMVAGAWAIAPLSLLDGIGIGLSALTVYGSAGFALFTVVNLAETSLRVEMLRRLLDNPAGLRIADLLAGISDAALIDLRVARIKQKRLVRVVQGRLYPRLSLLSPTAAGMSLLKRALYGRRQAGGHLPRNPGTSGRPSCRAASSPRLSDPC
jgi:hypothetical protein